MRKSALSAVLLLVTMIAAAGCGQKEGTGKVSGSVNDTPAASQAVAAVTPAVPATPEPEKKAEIKLYYADKDMLKLVEHTAEIRYTTDESKYLAALKALGESADPERVPLVNKIEFKSAKLAEGKLTVDLSLNDESRLGASGEDMLLQAFEKTSFQFEEVHALDLLVDGKAVESLMGHKDLPHPIEKKH